ncbi:MAG TPA: PQQ-dependent sugar dehydrogenase, partial [Planctomycetota bacterium]|nr:PQQ-dependent sugar dehydrogenase [Planctomycetota bacterium]
MLRFRASLILAALLAAATTAVAAQSFSVPPHFEVVPLPGDYNLLVGLTFAPDGTAFVIRKTGIVHVRDAAGQPQAAPFIDLSAEINNDGDRGLLSIALHPGFVPDGGPTSWVYLAYLVSPVPPNDNGFNQDDKYSFCRLTRYQATTSGSGIVAVAASRQVLLGHQNPDGSVSDCIASLHDSHATGAMRFASDGSLLLSTGDGSHYDFQDNGGADNAGFDTFIHPQTGLKGPTPKVQDSGSFRSQDLRSLSGKVLRLDPATGFGYPSNPFFDGQPASNASRVWALGLRNPYRFAPRPGTGANDPALGRPNTIYLGDVGWNAWEETDV